MPSPLAKTKDPGVKEGRFRRRDDPPESNAQVSAQELELARLLQDANVSSAADVLSLISSADTSQVKQLRDIVPVGEWIRSEYYLGDEVRTLWRFWEDAIVEFCDSGKNEFILTGSIRSGKSTAALITVLRKLYELSCYYPLPARFGLSPSSLLLFMYLSISMNQAMMLGLGRLKRMIDKIPYFREHFPRDRTVESHIRFDDPTLRCIGGSELGHFRGTDLFALIFDEANFTKAGIERQFDAAVDIYRESTIRRKSTFMVDGKEQGVGIIISSADTQSSFVEKHMEEVKSDPNVMIVHAVQYEVQPRKYAGQPTFPVFIGDEILDPFIVNEDGDALRNFCNIYGLPIKGFNVKKLPARLRSYFRDPPASFLQTFRLDIFGALKEVCGLAIGQSGRFFTNRVKFNQAFPRTQQQMGDTPAIPTPGDYKVKVEVAEHAHPFVSEKVLCSYQDTAQIKDYFLPDEVTFSARWEYFGGIDQSITDDTTGIALCHIDPEAEKLNIHYDFMLRVEPPKRPSKISPEKIVNFFIWLKKEAGISNLKVAMDWYATQQSEQTLLMNAVEAQIHSVDKTWDDYRAFAGSLLDGYISGYYYEPFKEEFFNLVQDNDRKKVDHPGGGSKDVSDAVVQAHHLALQAWMEIKGGIRYFPDFGSHNLGVWKYKDEAYARVVVGIYFGPEAFYAVWVTPESTNVALKAERQDYGGVPTIAFRNAQVKVLAEWVDHSSTTVERIAMLNTIGERFEQADISCMGDPKALIRKDINQVSPIKEFRRHGFSVKTRKRMDRDNLDPISMLLRNKQGGLLVHERECPLLIRALHKARHKMVKGVKTAALENTGEEYPLFALRVALEDALRKVRVVSY